MKTGGTHLEFLMWTEMDDGAGAGICDDAPSTCSSLVYVLFVVLFCGFCSVYFVGLAR